METQSLKSPTVVSAHPLTSNSIYRVLTWKEPLKSALAFLAVNAFFYVHIVWGHSICNILLKFFLVYLLYFSVQTILKKHNPQTKAETQNYEII